MAQALKAVSEVGELCDGVIKNDIDAIKDAIGDVAVCLVNVAEMSEIDLHYKARDKVYDGDDFEFSAKDNAAFAAADVATTAAGCAARGNARYYDGEILSALRYMADIANNYNLGFLDCCESAWLEIKDRRGKMVASGAFVKE